uniref:Fatty acid hydroxylase domain-containing protein n=1 Tax=Aplanochytrium stocchinoi TaxID=215587 RepID=A0A7S3LK40_9STRA|mmetsp:Transcript_16095/g.19164  ORF Transcript_16095/g.19164 Transcript_16095/m.19164 type:complete len:403 (+) Transcript_16095:125-1333(+)|eukprot:CAMPEP_0204822054 /NCGR_PEP_ID=MMETSP1346-20131115/240_1 /ASSEMBLY_ACC=CAM_ASM_000771 /TAXON_ID=215587 /ORGANISM="Aplanochytrium stocchinoi, Strain GSBS06" /LENGTH=402 /DNA_ID=CAMNT_0051948069 /DNA_START=71 /DNA_END=1279 /DNA_ORIENTATION=-
MNLDKNNLAKIVSVVAAGAIGYWWIKPFVDQGSLFQSKELQAQMLLEKPSKGKVIEDNNKAVDPIKKVPVHSSRASSEKNIRIKKPTTKPKSLPVRELDDNISYIQAFHNFLYPKYSEYYWYREGLVNHTGWEPKYHKALLWCLFTGMAGSGYLMGIAIYVLHCFIHFVNDVAGNETPGAEELWYMGLVSRTWFCLMMCVMSGVMTLITYYYGATRLEHAYNFNKDRQQDKSSWKCQPNKELSDNLYNEQKRWGLNNAFLAGFAGMGLFMIHLNHPFLKVYYDVSTRGWLHFWFDFVLVYFWVDIWAYTAHRFLHMKWIYKYIHKWHHRYKSPTAFSAFAMNPIEFITFQTGGILCCCCFSIHIMAFFGVVVYIAYHGQVDHSGIDFEGEMPWTPSVAFHDK